MTVKSKTTYYEENGEKIWLNEKGEWHREDGPAYECDDSMKLWYYHGKWINCQSQKEFERIINLLIFK